MTALEARIIAQDRKPGRAKACIDHAHRLISIAASEGKFSARLSLAGEALDTRYDVVNRLMDEGYTVTPGEHDDGTEYTVSWLTPNGLLVTPPDADAPPKGAK